MTRATAMLHQYHWDGEILYNRAMYAHQSAAIDVGPQLPWHSPMNMAGWCQAPPLMMPHALPSPVMETFTDSMCNVNRFLENISVLRGMSPQQVARFLQETAAAQGAYED